MKEKIFKKYVEEVCDLYDIEQETLFTKTKRRDCVDARHLLYYLCSERPMRLVYIQEYMAQNGYHIPHSSIHHGIAQVRKKIENNDRDYIATVKTMQKVSV